MKSVVFLTLILVCTFCFARQTMAQTTEFTYQGRLLFGGTPANGSYDFEFRLFDDVSVGSQLGATASLAAVNVNNGVFSVRIDFGDQFPGAARFLEIRVRQMGDQFFTVLSPRQAITSAPYAIRSLNAATADNTTQLGGVAASQFVQTDDTRLSDARNPTAGSNSYVQNSTVPQAGSNFNISGNGTAAGTLSATILNANSQVNIGGKKAFAVTTSNIHAGIDAGAKDAGSANSFFGNSAGGSNTTGLDNSFFGSSAGFSNLSGSFNAFFGSGAGVSNITGGSNSFFGAGSGNSNTSGSNNSFFGFEAGNYNTDGDRNSFFGTRAGTANTAYLNSFFGYDSGQRNTFGNQNGFFGGDSGNNNTTGFQNSFFGTSAGFNNTTGTVNSAFGVAAGITNRTGSVNSYLGGGADSIDGLSNATAVGAFAYVTQSNSLVLGSISGVNGANANVNVGIGTTAPQQRLHVDGTEVLSTGFQSGFKFRNRGSTSPNDDWVWYSAGNVARFFRAGVGDLLTIQTNGVVGLTALGSAGSVPLCRNASSQIATCSSSTRYKTNINAFLPGLSLIRRLRPVSFDWKESGTPDLGLLAEEVNKIEPRLTFRNEKGEIEGVKYDQLSAVFINAFKQQQAQIEDQQKQIAAQEAQIKALTKLVCMRAGRAAVCRKEK